MPVFSNFHRPKPAPPSSISLSEPSSSLVHASSPYEGQNDGKLERHNRSGHSHRHKHKSGRKGKYESKSRRVYENIDTLAMSDSTTPHLSVTTAAPTSAHSTSFAIRRAADPSILKHGVIHNLDLSSYSKSYKGVLGAPAKEAFVWSSDLRTFSFGREHVGDISEDEKQRKIRFEGRYCAKNAVRTAGTPFRKPTPSELQRMSEMDAPHTIRVPTGDYSSDLEVNAALEEQQLMEVRFLSRNRDLSTAVQRDPSDVGRWLDLVLLQDEFASLISGSFRKQSLGSGRASRVILEKKLEIFDKALEHNPFSVELMVGRLETIQMLHDPKEVNAEWLRVITSQSDSAPLWLAYLRFVQSYFAHFSIDHFRTAYGAAIRYLNRAKLKFLDNLLEFESCIADILVKACKVELQAGYTERAIAMLQASVEINFFAPEHVISSFQRFHSSPSPDSLAAARHSLLSSFQVFWESSYPRLGESGARGWKSAFDASDLLKPSLDIYDPLDVDEPDPLLVSSLEKLPTSTSTTHSTSASATAPCDRAPLTFPNEMQLDDTISSSLNSPSSSSPIFNTKDRLLHWIRAEQEANVARVLPLRPDQIATNFDAGDVDSVVLFEDIKDTLLFFSHPKVRSFVLLSFFDLCGVRLRMRHSSNSLYSHTRDLEMESLDEVFQILDSSCYPKMASIRPHLQTDLLPSAPIQLPLMFDYLDTHIPSDLSHSSGMAQLASNALHMLSSSASSTGSLDLETSQHLKLCRVLLGGDSIAKEILSSDQQDIFVWNAYLKHLITTTASNPKRLGFIRRTYNKIIQTFLDHPGVVHSIRTSAMMELQENDKDKAMDIIISLTRASMPPTVLSSSQLRTEEIRWARLEYARRSSVFANGISAMLQNMTTLVEPSLAFDNLLESLEVYFSLSIAFSVLECLILDIVSSNGVYETVRQALRSWSQHSPYVGATASWLIERTYMYQLNTLSLEYSRKNGLVPRGIVEHLTREALSLFPSNRYCLSLLASLGLRTQLFASTRRYFDLHLTGSPNLNDHDANRLMTWLFAARCETQSGAYARIKSEFERALSSHLSCDIHIQQSVLLWKLMLELEIEAGKFRDAKHLLFRAVQSCPWSKSLWFAYLEQLSGHFTSRELDDILGLMSAKQLRMHASPSF